MDGWGEGMNEKGKEKETIIGRRKGRWGKNGNFVYKLDSSASAATYAEDDDCWELYL